MSVPDFVRRGWFPVAVFAAVIAAHILWSGLFPERDPAQARWAIVPRPSETRWISDYVETKSYWLGYSYALSLAFAAAALRRYLERRTCTTRNLAVGSITLSGFLTVAGCFLLGCCGSPMLGVYLGLFGASFLPLAKPLMAGITTLVIGGSWWWMWHKLGYRAAEGETACDTAGENCHCAPATPRSRGRQP